MTEALKQFSAALLKDFQAALVKNQSVISKIKAAEGGTFKVIISTSDEDRQGDMLDQSKWKLDNYKQNPVVLWAHDYHNLPIAICTAITVEDGKLVAEGKFAPTELNPFAGQIAGLYEAGFINTTSVGYIQHEDGELELLEFSFVPVPANPYALSLRDIKRLKLNTAELVMKGITFKAPQIGDHCELDDGTPGVLSEDEDDPGEMVCVPAGGDKSMNKELTNNLKAEHTRHGEAVGKAIDEFSEKCLKGEKAEGELDKAIEEYEKAMDTEQEDHLTKCMKAIDDNYELEDQTKSIEEFKSEMKAEHVEHIKCFDKAIEEFKADADGTDERKAALDTFTTKAGDELKRHEKAQLDLCKAEMGEDENDGKAQKGAVAEEMVEDEKLQNKYKKLDRAWAVFSAFTAAYMDESASVDDFAKLLDEAVGLMKDVEEEAKGVLKTHLDLKAGRQISAKNKEKIAAVIKTIEDFKTAHAEGQEKHSNNVIAALKDLTGPEGNEGEETKPEKATAPKPKVEVREIKQAEDSFEVFMATRQILRTVDNAVGEALKDLNKHFREKFPARR